MSVRVKVLVAQSCHTVMTPLSIAHQAPLSMGFSRQECWSGLPFPSPGDLLDLGIKPSSPVFQVDSLPVTTWEDKRLLKKKCNGTSLLVQWLRLHAPTAGGIDSIPGWGTKILHAQVVQ